MKSLGWVIVVCVLLIASSSCSDARVDAQDEPRSTSFATRARYVDAAVEGAGDYSGYTYFIRGNKYRRYEWATDTNSDLGSLPLFAFHLPPAYHSGVDAVLTGRGDFANHSYFIKGASYVRYHWANTPVATSQRVDWEGALGAPEPNGFGLSAPFSSGVVAALNGYGTYSRYAYFFAGTQWVEATG